VLKKASLIIVVLFCMTAHAQFLDSIKSIIYKEPVIDARLETRNSFFENGRAKVSGVRLGLIFQKKIRVGIGYSWLSSDVHEKKSITNYLGNKDTVNNYLKFGYIAFYTDFVFYKTKRWQVSVPLQWGAGFTWFNYNNGAQDIPSSKDYLLLYEPGISVQFKIFRWCGLGTDIAYRFTLQNNQELRHKLNSPTYGFKVLIWFDQLYYIGFPKSKLSKKYGPAYW
jgi:hypothetical protein